MIIPAAGASRRYGEGAPELQGRSKLDEDMAGRPLLQRTVEIFVKRDDVAHIIVAAPAEDDAFNEFRERHGDKLGLLGVAICRGGAEHRWESVKNALELVPHDGAHVAIHDAARPCAPIEMVDRIFEAAAKYPAVVPAIDVADTLKRVSAEAKQDRDIDPLDAILGEAGREGVTLRTVEETIPRERLVAVQTPQVFELELLQRAYAQKDLSSTDDAGLVERLGEQVVVVEGDPRNLKVTRPADLKMAMSILGLRESSGRATHKKF